MPGNFVRSKRPQHLEFGPAMGASFKMALKRRRGFFFEQALQFF